MQKAQNYQNISRMPTLIFHR